MFKIEHKINIFGPMSFHETCDVRLIFLLKLFLCPHNYYNDNKKKVIRTCEVSDLAHVVGTSFSGIVKLLHIHESR